MSTEDLKSSSVVNMLNSLSPIVVCGEHAQQFGAEIVIFAGDAWVFAWILITL